MSSENCLDMVSPLILTGMGIIQIYKEKSSFKTKIHHEIGIGYSLLEKIVDMHKEKIINKKTGVLIDLVCDFSVYIHFFKKSNNFFVFVYLDKPEKIIAYSKLQKISQELFNCISKLKDPSEIKECANKLVVVPKSEGVLAILIIASSGHTFFTKINKEKSSFAQYEIQISGFISAILTFARELIGKGPDTQLREIDFGNRHFYINSINNLIFAYLVDEDKKSIINKRYMQLITLEFQRRYNKYVEKLNGDISRYYSFEEVIDHYFII